MESWPNLHLVETQGFRFAARLNACGCLLAISLSTSLAGQETLPTVRGPRRVLQQTPISAEQMRVHIDYLAGPDLRGRNSQQVDQAANYIQSWFQRHGLKPLFADSYFQMLPESAESADGLPPRMIGRNVGAYIEGTDPLLKSEFIVVNAHYDHLGTRGGVIYPGADDNASGTAMLLEVSRQLVQATEKPKRSVAFVAFDLEERLLWGSRWFVAHPPCDIDQIKCCITADMISRSLGGLQLPTVFVMGAERSPQIRQIIDDVGVPSGLETALLGIDLVGSRSDYAPFRDKRIPFLFFSTGEHPDYHQPTDTADRVDFEKSARVSNLILAIAQQAANLPQELDWTDDPSGNPDNLDEAEAVHRITQLLMEADEQGTVQLSGVQRFFVSQVKSKTGYIVRKGAMSPEDRRWLVRSAQLLLLSVF